MRKNKIEYRKCFQGHRYKSDLLECPYCPSPDAQRSEAPESDTGEQPNRTIIQPPEEGLQPESSSQKAVYITFIKGENTGRSMPIQRKAFIGNKDSNLIIVKDLGVKPIHATISIKDEVITLIDSSGAGIEVNGEKRYGRHKLERSDRITIGQTVLRIDVD